MDWTPLTFRDCVMLSSPGQPGWALVDAVVKRCRDVGANSIRVWPWSIVQEGQIPDISVLPIKAREPFASMTAVIDRIEVPSAFVERIKGEAIPFEGLQHWEEAMGFHPAASCTTEAAMSDKNRLKVLTYDEMPIMPMRPICAPVMVDEMFNSANTSFMYGPSNTGKSWLAIQLSIAKACGSNFFFLGKSAPQRVLYIDGEIGKGFRSRIDQLFDSNHNNIQLIRKNFIAISQRGLRISDPRIFDELMSIINEKEPDYVILDNVFSLTPKAAKGSTSTLFNTVHQIEDLGIGVSILHHTTKSKGSYKGPYELESLSQNVIILQDRDQITWEMGYGLKVPPVVKSVLQKPGPVARMVIKKCKVATEFERLSRFLVLKVNGGWMMYDSDGNSVVSASSDDFPSATGDASVAEPVHHVISESFDGEVPEDDGVVETTTVSAQVVSPEEEDSGASSPQDDNERLSPDAQRVLDFMSPGKPYTRLDLDTLWNGVTPDAAKNRTLKALKPLLENGDVSIGGEGRSRWYVRNS